MARTTIGVTLGQALPGGFNTSQAAVTLPATTAGTAKTSAATAAGALTTDVAAAVAVLIADGALPTQAHVNTLNTAWGLLATAIATTLTDATAAEAAVNASAPDVMFDYNTSTISTRNKMNAALRKLSQIAESRGLAP